MKFDIDGGHLAARQRGHAFRRMVLAAAVIAAIGAAGVGGYLYYRANSAGQLAARAQLALEQQDPSRAIEYLQKAIAHHPSGDTGIGLRNLMAQALMTAGREADARGYLQQVLAERPDNTQALDLLAQSYINAPLRKLREAFKPVTDDGAKDIFKSINEGLADLAKLPHSARNLIAEGELHRLYYLVLNDQAHQAAAEVDAAQISQNTDAAAKAQSQADAIKGPAAEHREQALAKLRDALKADPANATAGALIGSYEYEDRNYDQTLAIYDLMKKTGAISEDLVLAEARALLADTQRQPDSHARLADAQQVLDAYLKDHPQSTRSLVSLGVVLLDQEKIDEATKLGEQAAQLAPSDLAAQVLLINCKLKLKKPDDALRLITPLTNAHSNQPEVWYLLGMADVDLGDTKGAEDAFKKALAVNPGYVAARQALLMHEVHSGNTQAAASVAAQVLRDDRYNMPAWEVTLDGLRRLGQIDRARQLLANLAQDPQVPTEDKADLVRLLAAYDMPDQAKKVLGTLSSTDKETLSLRAFVAGAEGNSVESRDLIGKALAADPADVELRLKYVDLLAQAGLTADVRVQLDQAAASGKGLSADQWMRVARGYLWLRLPSKANESLKHVLDKEPQNTEALALSREAQGMLKGTAGDTDVAAAGSLQNMPVTDIVRLATASLKDRKYGDALSTARAGLAKDKGNVMLHEIAALSLAGLGKPDQGVDEVVEAARAQPDAAGAYKTFVEMFSAGDEAIKGIGYGARMESVNPALGNWAMGRLAQVSGDLDMALRYYRKGLDATVRVVDPRDARDELYQAVLNVEAQKKDAAALVKEADTLAAGDANFAPGIRLLAADQLLALADREDAQKQLEAVAAKLTPASRTALVLGVASRWLALGQLDRAESLMERQVNANGESPDLLDAYGTLLMQAHEYDKAVAVREKLCKVDGGNPVYRIGLAQSQAAAGDMPSAFRTLDDAQALGATGKELVASARVRLFISMGLLDQATQELTAAAKGGGGIEDSASRLAVAQGWQKLNKPLDARKMADSIPAYAAEYPAAQLLLAGLDLDAGNNDTAIKELKELQAKSPENAATIATQLFVAYLRSGNSAAALQLASDQRKGFIRNTPMWQTWTAYAATAAREGKTYAQAIDLLNSLDPEAKKGAMLDIALMNLLLNKPDEAARAAAMLPDDAPAHSKTTLTLLASPAALDASAAKTVMSDGLPSAVYAVLAAMPADQRAGQLEALKENPRVFQGDVAAVLKQLEKVHDASGALRQVALAQRLLEAGWSTTALDILAQVDKSAPGLTVALIQRHQALTDLHRYKEADAIADQLSAQARSNPDIPPGVRILLAAAWSKQERYSEALAILQPLAALNRPEILTTLATMHEKLGQLDEAVALNRQVRKINPGDLAAANNLAYLLAAAHPTDKAALAEAKEAIEFAIKKAPQVTEFQDTLGWIEILSGDPADGTRAIARALPALRLDPAVHYHLGLGYARMGQTALARMHLMNVSHLAQGKQNVPELPLATEALRTLASSQ